MLDLDTVLPRSFLALNVENYISYYAYWNRKNSPLDKLNLNGWSAEVRSEQMWHINETGIVGCESSGEFVIP